MRLTAIARSGANPSMPRIFAPAAPFDCDSADLARFPLPAALLDVASTRLVPRAIDEGFSKLNHFSFLWFFSFGTVFF